MAHGEGPTPTASVEALKDLKNVELDCESRLADARAGTQARLAKAREAAEATFAEARAEADRLRESTLQAARSGAQEESTRIVSLGEKDAAKIAAEAAKSLAAVRAKLMAGVLGEFWPASPEK
jgi:vacuolar-type H+-ATPase subunit H